MKLNKLGIVLVFAFFLLIGCSSDSSENGNTTNRDTDTFKTITGQWNQVAIDASGFDHTSLGAGENLGPTKASRAMAIVHIAMYDAANAASGQRYEPYLLRDVSSGASVKAAIAKAAHTTLVKLFPSQAKNFNLQYEKDLAILPNDQSTQRGIMLGARSAELILKNRANDGSDKLNQSTPYKYGNEPGDWRVDPENPSHKPVGANWYKVKPFVIKSATQFRAPPPPPIDSIEYAEAYAEAFRLGGDGITTPTERTEEQSNIGIYWAYDGTPSLCAPTRMYNQIAMQIASDRGITDELELTRLLVLMNVSVVDAGLSSWESKYHYNYWRPVTAIREADVGTGPTGKGDGNPNTFGDPTWTPLGAPASNLSEKNFTPPFPTYISGHSTFGGALFQSLRNYFGTDDISFSFVSDEFNGETIDNQGNVRPLLTRHFRSLSEAEKENGRSRVYLGIHWNFDDIEGQKVGNAVANYVTANAFRERR